MDTVPVTVRDLVAKICTDQNQPPISDKSWQQLAQIGEPNALSILNQISSTRIKTSFDGFISYLVRSSPLNSPSQTPTDAESRRSPQMSRLNAGETKPHLNRQILFEDDVQLGVKPGVEMGKVSSCTYEVLCKLEFRKLFMVLSYIGKRKLEEALTLKDADNILSKCNLPMLEFENEIWHVCGRYSSVNRLSQYDYWDSGKVHLYYCVVENQNYYFQGPELNSTRTHLQRSVGDDNVLVVKFMGDNSSYHKIAEEGIFVGLKHYQFFVFKDDLVKEKNNQMEKVDKEKKSLSRGIKCYFVHIDSGKSTTDARRSFMHVHTLLTLEKYMARFSLILSKTIKLNVDFGAVQITIIEDIPFRDETGSNVCDHDGSVLVHTDGTGFISEDLAMQCPKDFSAALHMKDNNSEKVSRYKRAKTTELPLLMQCRLFYNGYAVKGTLLLNKKLGKGTIQVRPSMIKVWRDETLPNEEKHNSLEIVNVSHRPGRNFLSRSLIALLTYGGVRQEFFLNLLKSALEDARNVYSDRRAALRVSANHDGFGYATMAVTMISSGIPLSEPYLQHCLSYLEKDDKKKLREGKIPIEDSFYLMGTADPTGLLEYNEVCVIFDHGPYMGDVLVYRHPGLHFGDVHVMKAVYKEEMEGFIGNSRHAIFFSTRGSSSAAYEMATGDFDGDLYWISWNPELLKTFKVSEPWKPDNVTYDCDDSKLPESSVELERELFKLFCGASKPSYTMATACHSWVSYMDRLLILHNESEKDILKKKMNRLINIYYDALDAPKSGKKVTVPGDLIAEKYPHYMNKPAELKYHSTSILGHIHDAVDSYKDESVHQQEISKLPQFDVPIPDEYITFWKCKYEEYCKNMRGAMKYDDCKERTAAADKVYEKYKKVKILMSEDRLMSIRFTNNNCVNKLKFLQLLYDADDFEGSKKNTEQIYEEALAIYHVTYDHVINQHDVTEVKKLCFAWNVAGSALCNLYAWKTEEKPLVILPSVLREALGGKSV